MNVLQVNNLLKVFTSGFWPFKTPQHYTIINNVSFALQKGEILGLLGPNGAGKTTLIQMLLGTLTPTSGKVSYFGDDFTSHRVAILKKVGYASGYDKLPYQLTVIDNLEVVGRIYALPAHVRDKRIKELLDFFGIEDLKHRKTGLLSAGQSTRVLLAKAFMAEPEIILLDEPTAALDPDIAHEVRQFILKQSEEKNVSVLITSHNMDEVTELCDRVLVLKKGEIIADNTPEKLAESAAKVKVHLTILQNLDNVMAYVKKNNVIFALKDNQLTVELDEIAISQFLSALSEMKAAYSHIHIDRPTLEDYFLSISKKETL